jgi:Skp family chaperone for outer membrane proteins
LQDVLGEKEQIESELTQSQAEAEQLQQALAQTQREASTLASQLAEAQRAAAAASFAMQQAADEQERSAHLEQEVSRPLTLLSTAADAAGIVQHHRD